MSLPRFFLQSQVISREAGESFELQLQRDDAKHARVLRLQPGEHIAVVDAGQDYFECEIVSMDGDLPVVRIAQRGSAQPERPRITLVQGLAKGEKMDEVIRHATELGVSRFIPLLCERSVVKLDAARVQKRMQRWCAIAKSAAMQSGQPCIPCVSEPMVPRAAAAELVNATAVLVCWEEASPDDRLEKALDAALSAAGVAPECVHAAHVAVVVGPEGGLTQGEFEAFAAPGNGYAVTLGPTILRTETAGIVAPALAMYELERRAAQAAVAGRGA